jgi:cobalt-precorrin 5A hydrolase
VAGIGCRAGVSGAQVEAAIEAAIAELCARQAARDAMASAAPLPASALTEVAVTGGGEPAVASAVGATTATGANACDRITVTAIATPAAKAKEPGIQAAAAVRGVPLLAISQQALEAANAATVTRSAHSMAAMNVHSVAEAAALAGALSLTNGLTTREPSPAPVDRTSKTTPRLLQLRVVVGPVTCALAETTTS